MASKTSVVKYVGRHHFRELAADDLKKAGVEGFSATSFKSGEEVEVAPEVAKALVENTGLFGEFEIVEREAPKAVDKSA